MNDSVESLFRAPGVQVYGDVRFAKGVSLWPNATIRAESDYVAVGAYSNIQDFVMVHIGIGPTNIGDYCSITHHSTIHGATIGNNCLIGINATIMDGAEIGDNCIVAGNSIVKEGTVIPPNSIAAGVPATVRATRNNYVDNKLNAISYYENALGYLVGNHRVWASDDYKTKMEKHRLRLQAELQKTVTSA